VQPRDPRIYLIRRRLRDLKKLSTHPSQFTILLEKALTGTTVVGLEQISSDRVIEVRFTENVLMVQLTGKSSNLFLLGPDGSIKAAARRVHGEGQDVGTIYAVPELHKKDESLAPSMIVDEIAEDQSVSEALDKHFLALDEAREFEVLADSARAKNRQDIAKLKRLAKNLNSDLVEHGDAERWKRFGDLLLANQNTAERKGNVVCVTDLFNESAPVIEVEADENDSIAEAAQKYFRRYAKARNARTAIESRLKDLEVERRRLEKVAEEMERAIADRNEEFLRNFVGKKAPKGPATKGKEAALPSGIRTYISSDGFEIMVGKKATDNDYLTSRIANSRDTWMHAADYPGSHVIIRNPNKKEIPHRTMIEAAQLAAFYSQGKKQPKAAVHYTLKKFVSKPKGAAPGLVRLASFKTILVQPKLGDVKPVIR
jgi:predicted ribosome quality control (RQC) complex YloA/Tae2 family protein